MATLMVEREIGNRGVRRRENEMERKRSLSGQSKNEETHLSSLSNPSFVRGDCRIFVTLNRRRRTIADGEAVKSWCETMRNQGEIDT